MHDQNHPHCLHVCDVLPSHLCFHPPPAAFAAPLHPRRRLHFNCLICPRLAFFPPCCLQRHYTRALLPELYKVVGSASVFGDPVRLFHHLGLGVWSFLASPAAGGVGLARADKIQLEGLHRPVLPKVGHLWPPILTNK
jgi:hypothetical protein